MVADVAHTVAMATPDIDDHFTIDTCSKARADIASFGKVSLELISHSCETFLAMSIYVHDLLPFNRLLEVTGTLRSALAWQ